MGRINLRAWVPERGLYRVALIDFESNFFIGRKPYGRAEAIALDNVVLMYYTGLKDRHGKMVYEGDIIKTSHEIKHRKSAKRYKLIEWADAKYRVGFTIGASNNNKCEIVGNKFEDMELLSRCATL